MINITQISKRMAKASLLLMLFLAQSLTSRAEVKLYMEDFTIASGETKTVSLMLDNDAEASDVQVTLYLPAGLNFVAGTEAKTARIKGRSAVVQASQKTSPDRWIILETDGTIAAGSGAIITFDVQSTSLADGDHTITISDIVVSNSDGDPINTSSLATATVKALGIANCTFAAQESSFEIAEGAEYQVDITLANDGATTLAALSGKLTLPEGLEVVEGEDGYFIYTDRTPEPLEFKFQKYDGYMTFLLSSSNNTLITGVDGVIFSFKVKASHGLAENTEIVLSDLRVANSVGKSAEANEGGNVTIAVTNSTLVQLAADKAAFAAYQTEQKAAADALAEDGDSDASKAIISDAKDAINGLVYDEAKTLDENKAAVDAIVAPLADALAAQRAAEQLVADKAAFAAYQTEQKAATDALAEDGDSDDCKALVADAKDNIDALTYDESKTLDENKAEVAAYVEQLATDLAAQRAQEAADQLAAAKAAFAAYQTEQKAAADALAEDGDSDASKAIIADAKTAIDALAYDESKTLEENKAAVDAAIAPLAAALAAQRAEDAEAAAAAQLAADKAAFAAYQTEQKAAADALAEDGDSDASKDLIADTKTAIDALAYDESKTLEENKAAVDAAIAPLAAALDAQRAEDAEAAAAAQLAADKAAFAAYQTEQKAVADALGVAGDSEACKTLIANAKDAIDALTYDETKSLDANKNAVAAVVTSLATSLAVQRAQEAGDQLAADKAAYAGYKTEQKAAADALAKADDSDACKTLIANVKDAIDALTYDESKTLAENKAAVDAVVAPLAAALTAQRDKEAEEAAAAQLAADKAAFAAYQTEQKAAADALAKDGDSDASKQLIADAKSAIDALTYDESKTLAENKAAVDAVVAPLAEALAAQRAEDEAAAQLAADKAAFAEYQAEQKAAADALAKADDSDASKQLIADAKAAIDALTYDENKTLAENKAAVDAVVAPLTEALAAQRDADAITAVTEKKLGEATVYDLSGRKVEKIDKKGIYIVNGKKVTVR